MCVCVCVGGWGGKTIKDACAKRPLSFTHSELRVFRHRHLVTHSLARPNTSTQNCSQKVGSGLSG